MSQIYRLFEDIETITGNSGGPVSPTAGNMDLIGTAPVTVTGNPVTSTLTVSVAGSVPTSFPTDSGTATPALGVLNVLGAHNTNTSGAGNTVTVHGNNTITLGDLAPVVGDALTITTGNETITAGDLTLTAGDVSLIAGNIDLPASNAAGTQGFIYANSSPFMSSLGTNNTFLGKNAGGLTSSPSSLNAAIGYNSQDDITSGSYNSSLGANALNSITTGSFNIAIGQYAANSLTTNDSSNIMIGNYGSSGDNHVIKIGITGSGVAQQDNCYIAGIQTVNVGSVATVVSHNGDHLGSTTITAGTGINVTPGANSITIETSGATATSFPTDSGTAIPALGALTVAGGTNIGSTGAGSTVTLNLDTDLTGLTSITGANGAAIRTGTTAADTLLLRAYDTLGTAYTTFATLTAGNPPTADLASGVTINSSYIYRAGGTDVAVTDGGTGLSTITDHGIMVGQGTSSPTTKVLTDGQVLIGSTGADPVAASLTAGAGISITPGAGSITITNTGGGGTGFTWAVTTVDASLVAANGYIANKAGLLTMTLPATGAIGDTIEITNMNTAVGWRIAQNANQYIRFGSQLTTTGVGGYLEATQLGDSARLVCNVAGASTGWIVVSSVGNLTVV